MLGPHTLAGLNHGEAKPSDLERPVSHNQGVVYSPRTFKDKLQLIDRTNMKNKSPGNMIGQVIRPFLFCNFPSSSFAAFASDAIRCG